MWRVKASQEDGDPYPRAMPWLPASMTREQDRADLARHVAEIEAHESFNYAFFDHKRRNYAPAFAAAFISFL